MEGVAQILLCRMFKLCSLQRVVFADSHTVRLGQNSSNLQPFLLYHRYRFALCYKQQITNAWSVAVLGGREGMSQRRFWGTA